MTGGERVRSSAVRGVYSHLIDRIVIIEIEWYLAAVALSSSLLIHICLTDAQLIGCLGIALYLRFTGHRKERGARMLISYVSLRRSGTGLSLLMDIKTCKLDKTVESPL